MIEMPTQRADEILRSRRSTLEALLLFSVIIAGITTPLLTGCDKERSGHATEQGASRKGREHKGFLTVTTDPGELAEARQLAALATPKPLSPEALGDLWVLSLDVLPAEMPRDQVETRLHQVVAESGAPMRARANAACLLALMRPAKGQQCILELLRGSKRKDKQALLLTLGFLDEQVLRVTDPELATELLSLISDDGVGASAIQTCGNLGVPGTKEALWQQLPHSGQETTSEILFWLVRLDPGRRTLTACSKALPEMQGRWRDRCLGALTGFFDQAETDLAQGAAELIAADLLDRIAAGKIGILTFPQGTCADVLRHGNGPRARALAEAVLGKSKDRYLQRCAYVAMRRYDGPERKQRILKGLARPEEFRSALEAIEEFYAKTGDTDVVDALVRETRKRRDSQDLRLLARVLITVGGRRVPSEVRAISRRLSEAEGKSLLMALERVSPLELATQLAANGIVAGERVQELVAIATAQSAQYSSEGVESQVGLFELLSAAGLLVGFDVETGEVPVRHDRLLADFAKASNGAFQPEACYEKMLRKHPEDWEAPYRVQFIHADRLYRINVRNLGDWYDVERIVLACNRALSDAGERRRFMQIASDGQCASFVCVTVEVTVQAKPPTFR